MTGTKLGWLQLLSINTILMPYQNELADPVSKNTGTACLAQDFRSFKVIVKVLNALYSQLKAQMENNLIFFCGAWN